MSPEPPGRPEHAPLFGRREITDVIQKVAIALIIMAVLAIFGAFKGEWIISSLGGVTREKLSKVDLLPVEKISEVNSNPALGDPRPILLGKHFVCMLTYVEVSGAGTGYCRLLEKDQVWSLQAGKAADGNAKCAATCFDLPRHKD
jgi:hypothetical protein